jgi:7,8-dihydropterin-6-yl-methyl-4-(beta-D-ribofuranosyl)aminobenzene 5'-phosphate synthase
MALLLSMLIFSGGDMANEKKGSQPGMQGSDNLKITVIYDNNSWDERLKNEWGFACLIESAGKRILFDTGGEGGVLLGNMRSLNIDPEDISIVFISHDHWDHTGGLKELLALDKDATVYLLPSFSGATKETVRNAGAKLVEIDSPAYLCEGIAVTGRLGTAIEEQSLVIETTKGLVVVTGCAHPGIIEIIKHVKQALGQDIYLVMGGFHLGGASEVELRQIIKTFREYGIRKAGPCHCSGELCRELFKKEYKNDFVDIGTGKIISVE